MSASTIAIFRNDVDLRGPIIEIVAIGVTVLSPDDSQETREDYFLGDDAMEEVSEAESDVIELAVIPKDKAKEQILSYVHSHIGCRTGDIIYDLALDPDLVLDSLRELESAKRIAGKDIDRK